MTRSIVAVVAGYLVFGISSAALFAATGRDPHVFPSIGFLVGSVVYGCAVAAAGGYLAARLADRRGLLHAGVVAAIIGGIAIASMIIDWRAGSVWSEVTVVGLMAPSALAGGYVRTR